MMTFQELKRAVESTYNDLMTPAETFAEVYRLNKIFASDVDRTNRSHVRFIRRRIDTLQSRKAYGDHIKALNIAQYLPRLERESTESSQALAELLKLPVVTWESVNLAREYFGVPPMSQSWIDKWEYKPRWHWSLR